MSCLALSCTVSYVVLPCVVLCCAALCGLVVFCCLAILSSLVLPWILELDCLKGTCLISICGKMILPSKNGRLWRSSFNLGFSCLVLSRGLSCLVWVALCCVVLSCLILYCVVLRCVASRCLVLFCALLSCFVFLVLCGVVLCCLVLLRLEWKEECLLSSFLLSWVERGKVTTSQAERRQKRPNGAVRHNGNEQTVSCLNP